jgi:hypothetical protein
MAYFIPKGFVKVNGEWERIETEMSEEKKERMFSFLDNLRDSGACNMLGSGIYLQEMFGINKRESKSIVLEWMKTFNERKSNGQVSA